MRDQHLHPFTLHSCFSSVSYDDSLRTDSCITKPGAPQDQTPSHPWSLRTHTPPTTRGERGLCKNSNTKIGVCVSTPCPARKDTVALWGRKRIVFYFYLKHTIIHSSGWWRDTSGRPGRGGRVGWYEWRQQWWDRDNRVITKPLLSPSLRSPMTVPTTPSSPQPVMTWNLELVWLNHYYTTNSDRGERLNKGVQRSMTPFQINVWTWHFILTVGFTSPSYSPVLISGVESLRRGTQMNPLPSVSSRIPSGLKRNLQVITWKVVCPNLLQKFYETSVVRSSVPTCRPSLETLWG